MALTSLKIEKDGMINYLQFATDQLEDDILRILLYVCNPDWEPLGDPQISGDRRTEEDFHIQLRLSATEKGHYVPEYSTDPQWNPGYKKEEHEDNTDQATVSGDGNQCQK
jgi:hypothetical protein